MKTDAYTKTVLTIIAAALIFIASQQAELFPKANASKINSGFVSVPLNPDGSINIKFSETMKVNIAEVGGNYVNSTLPMNVKEINGSSIYGSYGLPVNIQALSGSSIYDALPVKIKN